MRRRLTTPRTALRRAQQAGSSAVVGALISAAFCIPGAHAEPFSIFETDSEPYEPRTGEVVREYHELTPRNECAVAPLNIAPSGSTFRGPGVCMQPAPRCQPFDVQITGGERFGSASDLDSRSAESFVAGSVFATSLCWWGTHRVADQPGTPPANETFTVRYYENMAGLPGTPVGTPIVVTPTMSVTGVTQNGYSIMEYSANHAPVALTLGACYWVEIRQNQYTGEDSFLWWSSDVGNGHAMHDLDDSTPYAGFDELDTLDLAFCCNGAAEGPTGGGGGAALSTCGSPAPTDPACTLSPISECQGVTASPQAFFCHPGTQVIADDIRVATTVTLDRICWKGTYAVEPPAGEEDSFLIRVYADHQGRPGPMLREWFNGFFTLSRGFDGHSFDYSAEIEFDALTLNAGECYWIEIANEFADGGGSAQWAWLTSDGGNGRAAIDGGTAILNGYNLSDLLTTDMAMCVSGTLSTTPACLPPETTPLNDVCDTASIIALGQTLTGQTNINAGPGGYGSVTEPPCGYTLDNRATVWYSFHNTGAAQSVIASTCATTTDFDTVIDVYCSNGSPSGEGGGCGQLSCVSTNDVNSYCVENTRAGVAWLAEEGGRYWLRVHGKGGNVGVFDLSLTTGGNASAKACQRCEVVKRPSDIVESEVCGQTTNGSCAAAGVQTLAPGQVFCGTGEVAAGMRSGDVVRFGPFDQIPTLFSFAFEGEHPALVQVLTAGSEQACATDDFDDGYQVPYEPCEAMNITPSVQYTLNPKTGYAFVRVLPATSLPGDVEDFYGMPCGSEINEYRVSLSTSAIGACCTGNACVPAMTRAACAVAGGTYRGDTSVCGSSTCCPADFNHANGITVQDIFDFLTAWLAGSTAADFNGVNGVTVQDIFDFLTAWLAGC